MTAKQMLRNADAVLRAVILIWHLYIVKLRFAGVYLFFLFLLQNIDCGYSLEPSRRGGSNRKRVPTIYVLEQNKKNIQILPNKIFNFYNLKNLCLLHRHVFVMCFIPPLSFLSSRTHSFIHSFSVTSHKIYHFIIFVFYFLKSHKMLLMFFFFCFVFFFLFIFCLFVCLLFIKRLVL